jgi:hypothetical protein
VIAQSCASENSREEGPSDGRVLGVSRDDSFMKLGDVVMREGGVVVVRQIKVERRSNLVDGNAVKDEEIVFYERPYAKGETVVGGACVCCFE